MVEILKYNRAAWLAMGALVGFLGAGLLPQTPLHAVATDREENFAIATGPVDGDIEAVFFLDFLSGNLRAAVLSPLSRTFNSTFEANIVKDMEIDVSKNPKFLMVTGLASFRRAGGNVQPGASVVYVAELTSGKVIAYAVPWNTSARTSGNPIHAELVPLDMVQFRTSTVREAP